MKLGATDIEDQFRATADELLLNIDVLWDGSFNSSIAIVGEGPGETEVKRGLPWVGGAGKMLFDTLSRYKIQREKAFVTNVVKRQISLSRKGGEKHAVGRDELDKWIGLLKWELSQMPNLRTVFVMGNTALEALLGVTGILNWRGSVVEADLPNGKKGQVVCTINPAYAIQERKMEPPFILDCQKLDMVVRGVFVPYKIEHLINPTYKEAMAFVRDLKKTKKPVSFDIEVINQETACFGLANDGHKAMCINLRDAFENRFTLGQEADIWNAIQNLCESHKIVAQNGSFDAYWTRLHDRLRLRVWFDTLLAHHTLYPQLPHGLGFLCSQYTTHPFYKDEGKAWKEGGNLDQFWRYNCKDAAITYKIYEREASELKSQKLDKFFFEHVMRAQPHLVEATVHGLRQDEKVKEIIKKQCQDDVGELEAKFLWYVEELTDDPDYKPNFRSWQQLQQLFFDVLKLEGKGKSTDETNRIHIINNPRTPLMAKEMLTALNKLKEEDKFLSTYANSRPSADGRMRCEYKQYGTQNAPGRLSSSQLITGEGQNLQNIPVRARAMTVADEDCVFVYFDLKQAEAQIVGYRANIAKWKEDFARAKIDGKFDCHRSLAADMFKIPYDQVPKEDWDENNRPTRRYISKRCRHGLNYRMEKWRLSEVTELPFYEAAKAFTLYHKANPELELWWEQEEKAFRMKKEVYNALGRRLKVLQRLDDDSLKSLIAYYPQSTVGDKVVQTWYMCEEDDEWPVDARICLNVHDNLVGLAKASQKTYKTALKIMKKHAESPIWIQDAWGNKAEPLSIGADLKVSIPTVWDTKFKNKKGEVVGGFVEDKKSGLHRWNNMISIEL